MYCKTDCKYLDKDNNCVCKEECARLYNDMYEKKEEKNNKIFFSVHEPSYCFRTNTENADLIKLKKDMTLWF